MAKSRSSRSTSSLMVRLDEDSKELLVRAAELRLLGRGGCPFGHRSLRWARGRKTLPSFGTCPRRAATECYRPSSLSQKSGHRVCRRNLSTEFDPDKPTN